MRTLALNDREAHSLAPIERLQPMERGRPGEPMSQDEPEDSGDVHRVDVNGREI